jgi:hypothetical protein
MDVSLYDDSRKDLWDAFVRESRNATFLFLRDYMDYHRDRFEDHSLLVRDAKEDLVALFPATRTGQGLVSHGGLTYGGCLVDDRMRTPLMLEVFRAMVDFLKGHGLTRLTYKAIPHIYHRHPTEEDLYALFRCGAALSRRDVSTCLEPSRPGPVQERRLRGAAKAKGAGVACEPSEDFDQFWQVLEWNLSAIHGRKPVHTLEEIRLLRSRFPRQIRLFAATLGRRIVGGTVIYESENVAHAQYTASSEEGRAIGALDLLFQHLIGEVFRGKRYFDLGVSTESQGRVLNEGLVDFKEGLGARAVVYDHYELAIA